MKNILRIKYKNLETNKNHTLQKSSFRIEDLESIQVDMSRYDHLKIISSKIKDNRNISIEEELRMIRKKLRLDN